MGERGSLTLRTWKLPMESSLKDLPWNRLKAMVMQFASPFCEARRPSWMSHSVDIDPFSRRCASDLGC